MTVTTHHFARDEYAEQAMAPPPPWNRSAAGNYGVEMHKARLADFGAP